MPAKEGDLVVLGGELGEYVHAQRPAMGQQPAYVPSRPPARARIVAHRGIRQGIAVGGESGAGYGLSRFWTLVG
jgi:hypothetical protein